MRRYFSLVLVFLLSAGPAAPLARASSPETTLVVYSSGDGIADEASQKTAVLLREKLREKPRLKIIAPENVNAVLKYYRGYAASGEDASARQAGDFLGRAKEHYFQMDYATVRAELERVFEIFRERPELLFTDGMLLFDGWVTYGLAEAAQKKKEKALQAFREAFQLNPFYKIDPKAFSPSVQTILQQAGADLFKNKTGSLRVAGEPKVADIYLNGIYQGVSPKTFLLPAGEYALSFRANNYRGIQQHVSIRPGETASLEHKLYWQGPEAPKEAQANAIAEGLRIAELLKFDKVLLVDVDAENIRAQMIDRRYRAAHQAIVLPNNAEDPGFEEKLQQLIRFVYAQTQLDLLKNPQAHLDPDGIGDPILLGGRRRKVSKGVLYGGLGGLGVVGILAGVLAAGSGGRNTGTVTVNFK
ncbi:MAG: PEGA domain-containing protein [Deltaproteobacteria bacterium]|nr:PEGA domain-containing protein [Deltaproteobacteria bacterium]